jgi:hypothetical protein
MIDPSELLTKKRFEWERIILRLVVPSNLRAVKLIGLALATYANADGTNVHPGEKRLMAECQLSERTVRDSLKHLREIGLIYRHSRGSNLGKTNYADVYQLCVPKGWADRLPLLPEDRSGEQRDVIPG